jgi:NADH-quinone oxidoreductase subunit G
VAAQGLLRARDGAYGVGVLTGGRLTVEDAYAYSKFTRAALHSNDIDFRARPHSMEEAQFLASTVAGATDVTYTDVDSAPAVVLVGLEPEEECPILFLRLRKATARRLVVHAVAPFAAPGFAKLKANLISTTPGDEATVLATSTQLRDELSRPGAILFVGERLATVQGGLSAAVTLAAETGAKLAWVPRRAGERGAVDAGCLPNLLPGGRPVIDAAARAELGDAWNLKTGTISGSVGRDGDGIVAAAAGGKIGALIVAGVDPGDLSDPALAEQALDTVDFLVSLEIRNTSVARRADVVFPVAPAVEKAGTFLDWEGRLRPFGTVLETDAVPDARVLDALAREMGVAIDCGDVVAIRRELGALPATRAERVAPPKASPVAPAAPGDGRAVLSTWHQLLDLGSLIDGDPALTGTARPAIARMTKATAAAVGIADGDEATVGTERGAITLPVVVTDMPDGVVWLPANSPGSTVNRTLGVTSGAVVTVTARGVGGAQ